MNSSITQLKRVRPLLGTFVAIEIRARSPRAAIDRWISAGFGAIETVDRLMSAHRADSDLTRLNRAERGQVIDVHPWTLTVLKTAERLRKLSEGHFDIRCGAALAKTRGLSRIDRASLSTMTYGRALVFNARTVCKTGPWTLDLGGLAKGFAVDQAVRVIRNLAIGQRSSGCVNAGGDLRSWGTRSQIQEIRVSGDSAEHLYRFAVGSTALATSTSQSVADSCWSAAAHVQMPSGKRFRHSRSAAVFSTECLWADALTKVALMAPPEILQRCLSRSHAKALQFNHLGCLVAASN